jgi:hypothetical protein
MITELFLFFDSRDKTDFELDFDVRIAVLRFGLP